MARAATDTDFNNASRYLELKLEIYFDGIDQTPLTVLKSDYLVDADWLEEGSADSSNPFGSVSSNELSFRLFNENGMFSPTNASGPYYGKIKSGVQVKLFTKPIYDAEEVNWEQLGVYYVTGWEAAVTGTYADVTANDKWHSIFNKPVPNYPVSLNKTYKNLLDEVFTLLGVDVTVSSALTHNLPYAFIEGTIKSFMQEMMKAALAYATTSKLGVPIIGSLTEPRTVRATLTDANQIKNVAAKQSITKSYDGVELKYSLPQISAVDKLVELTGLTLANGQNNLSNLMFTKGPMWQVSDIAIKSPSTGISLSGYTATPWQISLDLLNSSPDTSGDVSVFGTVVDLTEVTITDDVSKILKVASKYIQSAVYATYYNTIMTAFVSSSIPMLSLSVRGNPLLNIGDRVLVQSTMYNLEFSGLIQRMAYKYAGALSCEMVLLNTDVLQGVVV